MDGRAYHARAAAAAAAAEAAIASNCPILYGRFGFDVETLRRGRVMAF